MHTITGGILAVTATMLVANCNQTNVRSQSVEQTQPPTGVNTSCQVQANPTTTTTEQISPDRNPSRLPAPELSREQRERMLERTEIEPTTSQCVEPSQPLPPDQ